MLLARADKLGGNELVASLLEAGDDVADQTSLDAIWLNGNEAGRIVRDSILMRNVQIGLRLF